MVSNRCKMTVKEELKKLDLHFVVVDFCEVDVMKDPSMKQLEHYEKHYKRQDWS